MCNSGEPSQSDRNVAACALMGGSYFVYAPLLKIKKSVKFGRKKWLLLWLSLAWLGWGCLALAQSEQGLVAYYPFTGDARDASGSGNDGVVNGATLIEDRFGNPESAYYFDGEDDNIVVENSPSLNMAVNHQITISAWVRPEDLEADRFSHVVRKASGRSGAGFLFAFQNRGRELSLGINNSAGQESNTTIDPNYFTDDAWHFIAGTFDGQAFRIYVDGRLIGTELLNQRINPNGEDPMFIGSYWRGQFFQGGIDDLRLYNRALTTSELEQLFEQERPAEVSDAGNGARVLPPPPPPSQQPAAPAQAPELPSDDLTPIDDFTADVTDDVTDEVTDDVPNDVPEDSTPVLTPPPMPQPIAPAPATPAPPSDAPADTDAPVIPTEVPATPPETPTTPPTMPPTTTPTLTPTPADTPVNLPEDIPPVDISPDTTEIILPPALQPEDDGVCNAQVANYVVDSRRLVIPVLYVELLDALSREPTGQFATFAVTLTHEPEGRTFTIVTSSVSLVPEEEVEVACRAQYDGRRIEIPLLEADAYIQSLPGVRLPAPRQRLELTLRQYGDDARAFRVESFELR